MLLGATQKSAGGRVAEVGALKRLLTRACMKNLTAAQNTAALEWFTEEADGVLRFRADTELRGQLALQL
jgi:hypothetical protein